MLAIVCSFGQWRAELQCSPHKINVYTDHKALEYFMSTKALNTRQARWAEFLAQYDFLIKYRSGRSNAAADALSRRDQDVKLQDQTKVQLRRRALLSENQFENKPFELNVNFMESFEIADKLLRFNREDPSLECERELARTITNSRFQLENGLLLYDKDRLVVPDVQNIRTCLVKEAHAQPSSAHPGPKKTLKLLSSRYYWKGMKSFIERFISNCHPCRRSHINHDKTPGFLHCLPIPDYLL